MASTPCTTIFTWHLLLVLCELCVLCEPAEITGLSAEPGFRYVNLTWQGPALGGKQPVRLQPNAVAGRKPAASHRAADFLVKYCEIQVWGEHHCREKAVRGLAPSGDKYTLTLTDLKISTEYKIYVSLLSTQDSKGDLTEFEIQVETLGFSATPRNCSPQHTEVEVYTGPGFTGLIAAEGAPDLACSIQGTGGRKELYTLSLDHKLCGSSVNSSEAQTYVVVQESSSILTHSTRRFLIMCKFGVPDVFTVKSGLNLPYTKSVRAPGAGTAIREPRKMQVSGTSIASDKNADDIITLEDYTDREEVVEVGLLDHLQRPVPSMRLRSHQEVKGDKFTTIQKGPVPDAGKDAGLKDISVILVIAGVGVVLLLVAVALLTVCRKTRR